MAGEFSNKVINFQSLKAKKQTHKVAKRAVGAEQVPITDITHKRQQMIAEERRNVRRTILTEFVGAFVIIPQRGLARVSLYDISDTGVSFDIDSNSGQLMIGDEIAMRVYLNNKTYFPFAIKVNHVRNMNEHMCYRHGASFVKGTINDVALHHFVKFIESVSSCLETDHGDIMISSHNPKA
ncbi:MAG: PilZ domain-containing protein [Pseudomonadota bacterium]|nr:PilZ domain-containing protein [Pseudomonadota bacterium]